MEQVQAHRHLWYQQLSETFAACATERGLCHLLRIRPRQDTVASLIFQLKSAMDAHPRQPRIEHLQNVHVPVSSFENLAAWPLVKNRRTGPINPAGVELAVSVPTSFLADLSLTTMISACPSHQWLAAGAFRQPKVSERSRP